MVVCITCTVYTYNKASTSSHSTLVPDMRNTVTSSRMLTGICRFQFC